MSERLHYFTEATTVVSFDCSDSDIESDVDVHDSRRPLSASDRAKQHTLQLQLWSDEARGRRRTLPTNGTHTHPHPGRGSIKDRQQSNLSERKRNSQPQAQPKQHQQLQHLQLQLQLQQQQHQQQSSSTPSSKIFNSLSSSPITSPIVTNNDSFSSSSGRILKRSHSAKNLRIRITPSSSSKSLLSDVSSAEKDPNVPATTTNYNNYNNGRLVHNNLNSSNSSGMMGICSLPSSPTAATAGGANNLLGRYRADTMAVRRNNNNNNTHHHQHLAHGHHHLNHNHNHSNQIQLIQPHQQLLPNHYQQQQPMNSSPRNDQQRYHHHRHNINTAVSSNHISSNLNNVSRLNRKARSSATPELLDTGRPGITRRLSFNRSGRRFSFARLFRRSSQQPN